MFQFWPSVIKPILQAADARRVIEIGAGEGRNSRQLASWAQAAGARLEIIDPAPDFDMERLRDRFPDAVGIHRRPSLEIVRDLLPADVVLIDGDHNWYTVYHELVTIYGDDDPVGIGAPIAICHDVEWPYARRDLYYCPERIPQEYRRPSRIGGVLPQERGLFPGGYNSSSCHAEYEGGLRNGVKTAIEDFLAKRGEGFQVIWLPMLFGLAVIVPRARIEASDALGALIESLDLSRPLRSLCKMAELERIRAGRPQLAPVGSGSRPGMAARSFSSALPDDVLTALLKGCLDYRYKGRAMLLNPLDMANYLALLGQLRPAAVIEIGSLEGGRTLWLADTMASLGLDVRIISVDLMSPAQSGHPGIDARVGDARNLAQVLSADEVRSLGHPLLVIEDSAHDEETCTAVLDFFDPLLAAGDYVVVEDGAFRSDSDTQPGSSTLSPPSRAIDAFLARRARDYEIDEALCDRFGYNATFNINGWLRRR